MQSVPIRMTRLGRMEEADEKRSAGCRLTLAVSWSGDKVERATGHYALVFSGRVR